MPEYLAGYASNLACGAYNEWVCGYINEWIHTVNTIDCNNYFLLGIAFLIMDKLLDLLSCLWPLNLTVCIGVGIFFAFGVVISLHVTSFLD